MFVYDIDELAIIYDTLEFIKSNYNITVEGIATAKSVIEVKHLINAKINSIILNQTDQKQIDTLKKYILK